MTVVTDWETVVQKHTGLQSTRYSGKIIHGQVSSEILTRTHTYAYTHICQFCWQVHEGPVKRVRAVHSA